MLLQLVCQCHTQERVHVILHQAPVCASCMTAKVELVYSLVLKGPDSDLRPFPPLICQLLTPHSHQAPRGIHFRCFLSLFLLLCHFSFSLQASFDFPFFSHCTSFVVCYLATFPSNHPSVFFDSYPVLSLSLLPYHSHVLVLSHLAERDIVCRRCQSPQNEVG